MFDFIKRIFNWFRTNIKIVLVLTAIVSVGVATLGIFVPGSRPVLTWLLNSLVTIVQLLFWLLSLPYKAIMGL